MKHHVGEDEIAGNCAIKNFISSPLRWGCMQHKFSRFVRTHSSEPEGEEDNEKKTFKYNEIESII